MTIHAQHPFLGPESERDQVRRLRGRLGGTVSLWTTGSAPERAGLTVSSLLVAPGEPGHALALLDPDSALAAALQTNHVAVVQLLEWEHRGLADAFAGQAPAPGGAFRLGQWSETQWGPLLSGCSAWAGVRLVDRQPTAAGWSVLVDAVIEHVHVGTEVAPLVHRRGRYQRPSQP